MLDLICSCTVTCKHLAWQSQKRVDFLAYNGKNLHTKQTDKHKLCVMNYIKIVDQHSDLDKETSSFIRY